MGPIPWAHAHIAIVFIGVKILLSKEMWTNFDGQVKLAATTWSTYWYLRRGDEQDYQNILYGYGLPVGWPHLHTFGP
jgi:hypothetical protein